MDDVTIADGGIDAVNFVNAAFVIKRCRTVVTKDDVSICVAEDVAAGVNIVVSESTNDDVRSITGFNNVTTANMGVQTFRRGNTTVDFEGYRTNVTHDDVVIRNDSQVRYDCI